MNIPLTKPYFGEEERRAVTEPLDTGWVIQGPKVAEFERLFAAYTGAPFALATTSCTTALHLALVALGVGPGDEVIVPVSLFGISAPMQPILENARRYDLKVVEDAACALGAWYGDHHAGTLADLGCFSFHPRKAITTGEGGMVITADEMIAQRIQSLRDHGASKSDLASHLGARSYVLPDFNVVGYNYRMTDLQGALGVAQMGRLVWMLEQRTRLAHRYDEALAEVGWLRPPMLPAHCRHGYQAYVCLFEPEPPTVANVARLCTQRNALMDALETVGIASRPGTHAVHMLGYYRNKYGLRPEDFPNAYLADQLTLTLPLYAQMTEAEQAFVLTHVGGYRL